MSEHDIRYVNLDKISLSWREFLSDFAGVDLIAERWRDILMKSTIFELRATLLGQRHQVTEFKWPDGWWQAFKLRFFPHWLLRRFPVRYHVGRVTAFALLPTLDLKIPGHQTVVAVMAEPLSMLRNPGAEDE